MKKVIDVITPYANFENTCQDVISYFENGATPQGPYIALAKFFRGSNSDSSKYDMKYMEWLKDLIDNDKEDESIILSTLKVYYNKDELKRFVFELDDMDPRYNQKWHYFISYWGYREFATFITKEYNKKVAGISIFKNDDEVHNGKLFQCEELKIWLNKAKNKQ